eukprot:gene20523-27315_t
MAQAGWDFFANEFTLPTGEQGLCQHFTHLLLYRNPIDRLRSHISWIEKLYKEHYTKEDISDLFQNRTSSFWEKLLPAGVNNYYIRSLLGEQFFEGSHIRSSDSIKEEVRLPLDFGRLVQLNHMDMQVYRLAQQLQALDILLFNFVYRTGQLGSTKNLGGCGYVNSSNSSSSSSTGYDRRTAVQGMTGARQYRA